MTEQPKEGTSFRLTDDARRLLRQLADRQGISMTAVIELLIRAAAKKERIQ